MGIAASKEGLSEAEKPTHPAEDLPITLTSSSTLSQVIPYRTLGPAERLDPHDGNHGQRSEHHVDLDTQMQQRLQLKLASGEKYWHQTEKSGGNEITGANKDDLGFGWLERQILLDKNLLADARVKVGIASSTDELEQLSINVRNLERHLQQDEARLAEAKRNHSTGKTKAKQEWPKQKKGAKSQTRHRNNPETKNNKKIAGRVKQVNQITNSIKSLTTRIETTILCAKTNQRLSSLVAAGKKARRRITAVQEILKHVPTHMECHRSFRQAKADLEKALSDCASSLGMTPENLNLPGKRSMFKQSRSLQWKAERAACQNDMSTMSNNTSHDYGLACHRMKTRSMAAAEALENNLLDAQSVRDTSPQEDDNATDDIEIEAEAMTYISVGRFESPGEEYRAAFC